MLENCSAIVYFLTRVAASWFRAERGRHQLQQRIDRSLFIAETDPQENRLQRSHLLQLLTLRRRETHEVFLGRDERGGTVPALQVNQTVDVAIGPGMVVAGGAAGRDPDATKAGEEFGGTGNGAECDGAGRGGNFELPDHPPDRLAKAAGTELRFKVAIFVAQSENVRAP